MADICVRCVDCNKAQHWLKPTLIAFRCVVCGGGTMTAVKDVAKVTQEDDRYTCWRSACGTVDHLGVDRPPSEMCVVCKVPVTWKLFRRIGDLRWADVREKNIKQDIKQDIKQNMGPRGVAGDSDSVNHPEHYRKHASGIECIDVAEHMNFCLGNAIKYIWRAGLKSHTPVQDLQKAAWYIAREIRRLNG